MALATLRSICYSVLHFWAICLYICVHASEPAKQLTIKATCIDLQNKQRFSRRFIVPTDVTKNLIVFCSVLENSGPNNPPDAPLEVDLEKYTDQKTALKALPIFFNLATNNPTPIPQFCTENTIFMELAEEFEASAELHSKIVKIPFTNHVYDTLYAIALRESPPQESNSTLDVTTAQKWFIACIPYASDTQKTELRKKLYPLQYQSPKFIALRKKVIHLLKKQKTNDKCELPAFDDLAEFKSWQTSFLHQAYCAARPVNALSSAKFQEITNACKLKFKDSLTVTSTIECIKCKKQLTFDRYRDRNKYWVGCNDCMKQALNGKVIDFCDCYNLDDRSIEVLISHNLHQHEKYFIHLPQIHLPLLELLIHYKNIRYYQGDGGYHPSTSRINFGITAVDLNPVDIKALSMFKVKPRWDYRDCLICTFNVNSKKNVTELKSELSHLRQLGNLFIKFIAPDADSTDAYNPNNDGYNWRENDYHSVWVDNWFLRAAIGIAGLCCVAKIANGMARRSQSAYDIKLGAYNTRLNEQLSTVPEHIQAVTGYLAKTQDPIFLNLPSELKMPLLKGDPNSITLFDIKKAQQTACALNQIAHPTHPGGFWYYSSWITGSLFVIGAILRINFLFFNYPIITACRIAVVKPYYEHPPYFVGVSGHRAQST